ncbi:hypothetical protein MRB53_013030 [Persea americana]|uniref:Uncharacterized protein n=1 Tax=Persea americana TaxID=3435 RepID=A0ACC2LZZ0_PERAE|nr:hypothetical protein MRB53_013030 [Persea americana]
MTAVEQMEGKRRWSGFEVGQRRRGRSEERGEMIRLSFLCFFVRRFGRQEQERERFKLLEGFCLPEPFMQLTLAVGSAWHIYGPYSTSHRVVRSVRI